MSLPEDIDRLACLKNLAQGTQSKYQEELARISVARSPFQMGAPAPVTGWSFRGKSLLVDHLSAGFVTVPGGHRLEVTATGCVLSTAGQPTKNRANSQWSEVYKC